MQNIFIRHLKELQGDLSVTAFAKMLEMPQNTLDCYIKERRKPSVDFILRICSKCGVSADWLLGLSDERGAVRSVEQAPSLPAMSSDVVRQLRELESRVTALESRSRSAFACG